MNVTFVVRKHDKWEEYRVKKARIGLILFAALGGFVFLLSFYEPTQELNGFPVPKTANLLHEGESSRSYDWTRASEEKGIPFDYDFALRANGWKILSVEELMVTYTKGIYKIALNSTSNRLDIIKINKRK